MNLDMIGCYHAILQHLYDALHEMAMERIRLLRRIDDLERNLAAYMSAAETVTPAHEDKP